MAIFHQHIQIQVMSTQHTGPHQFQRTIQHNTVQPPVQHYHEMIPTAEHTSRMRMITLMIIHRIHQIRMRLETMIHGILKIWSRWWELWRRLTTYCDTGYI